MSQTLVCRDASTSLTSIPSALLDGKFVRVQIAGIAGATSVKLYLNGNQILSMTATIGQGFFNEICMSWNSTNQDVKPQTWLFGTPSNFGSFNPATMTFSTDASHTVTDFVVLA